MKKVMLFSMMLMVALVANAQLKVTPKLTKGLEKQYVSEMTMSIPGQGDVKMSVDDTYKVADETADGYVIELTTNSVNVEADANNIVGKLMGMTQEMMKGIKVLIATDKDGKVLRITNFEELKPKMEQCANKLVEDAIKDLPQLESMKDMLKTQTLSAIDEEKLQSNILEATSVLVLNGKTLMTGAQEDFVNGEGLKMKRMYFVNGKSITTNSTMNMSKEDMKELIIKQVEASAPEQAAMVKENIDQLLEGGMLKIEMKEKATYELDDDGWVKSLKTEASTDSMGQSVTTVTTVRVKN